MTSTAPRPGVLPATTFVGNSVVGSPLELTVLMPCLDEAETLATCIRKAQAFLREHHVLGEVLVADNGSTDGSQEIARRAGARVVEVPEKGYGHALLGGIRAARGEFVIMGDADDSYDFTALDGFLAELRSGADLVMGDRFAGGIERGAMPGLHRYVGNPVLSFMGRLFFGTTIRDFHCGLRGFRRDRLLELGLQTTGMEFASEVVVRSVLAGFDVAEVPTPLTKDGRSHPPHLRSFRDGWRHLRFLLLHAPTWLFLLPGCALTVLGAAGVVVLLPGPRTVAGVTFDLGSLVYAVAALLIGLLAVTFWFLTKVYAIRAGLLPPDARLERIARRLSLEAGLVVALVLFVLGAAAGLVSVVRWGSAGLGPLNVEQQTRTVLLALIGIVLSAQVALSSFFVSVLRLGGRDGSPRVPSDTGATEALSVTEGSRSAS